MLADSYLKKPITHGELGREVHLAEESRRGILDFVAGELPRWRADPKRAQAQAETTLTDQLCSHLNSAARRSTWDFLQFRTETGDEAKRQRKIDLTPQPCDATVWIEGRAHTHYDAILPIECKRLPTPKDKDRDPREYVFTSHGSTGGMQRFKAGHHGSAHVFAGMIGYLQEGDSAVWHRKLNSWIGALAKGGEAGWCDEDKLAALSRDIALRTASCCSKHARPGGLADIEIQHLWIEMN